jgi:hypothetical protein
MKTANAFKNGDRVIYKPKSGVIQPSAAAKGKKATIVDVDNGLIQFDENVGGHKGDPEQLPEGTGWYVNLERDLVRVKRGRPTKKSSKEYDEVLSEVAKSLKGLEQVDIDEFIEDIKARAERRRLQREAKDYFEFGESYELGLSTISAPMYIRHGLADTGFEGRELGFNTAEYEIRINDLVVPDGAVLRVKKK